VFNERRISQRRRLHAHGFATAPVKLLEPIELLRTDWPLEPHSHGLRDRRTLAAIHGKPAGNAPDRRAACRPESPESLRALDGGLRFRKLHPSSQLQIQK